MQRALTTFALTTFIAFAFFCRSFSQKPSTESIRMIFPSDGDVIDSESKDIVVKLALENIIQDGTELVVYLDSVIVYKALAQSGLV